MNKNSADIIIGITGASGAGYAITLMQSLVKQGCVIHCLITDAGRLVLATESDLPMGGSCKQIAQKLAERFGARPDQIILYGQQQWTAPFASGSAVPKSMVVCPCTVGCLSAIATGASNNLLERAADVMLKEKRQLILVVRETPLSSIHLNHMLTLSQMGATILPANPGFYHHPENIQDIYDFIAGRVLDHLEIDQTLVAEWGKAML